MTPTRAHATQIVADRRDPADPDHPRVRCAPAKVFRAHADPDLVVKWLGPRNTEMRIDHYDCGTGGSYRYIHVSDGNEYGFHGSFHEVRPSEVIVQTFTFEASPTASRWSASSSRASATAAPA